MGLGYWNYRIIYKRDKENKNGYYGIYEVYYSKKGKIKYWTVEMIEPYGETKKGLKTDMKRMKKAFKKPVLVEKKKGNKIILIEKRENK